MDWSWENGPLEMAQNFLLATGFLLMLVYARRTAETELRQFGFGCYRYGSSYWDGN